MVATGPKLRVSPLVVLLIAGLVIVLIVTFFISIRPVSAPTDLAGAQAKVFDAGHELDLFLIQYAKTMPVGNAEAKDALAKSKAAFDAAKASLATVDEATVNQLAADFATLEKYYTTNTDPNEITGLVRNMKDRLSILTKSLQAE